MDVRPLAACAEYPNDNPALHRGGIWFCAALAAPPEFEPPEVPAVVAASVEVAALAEPPTDPTPPVLEADDDSDDIEIVEDLAFDDAIDESPSPPEQQLSEPELPAADDAFATLVHVLEDVARGAGADEAALTTLRTLVGQLRIDAGAPADHQRIRGEAVAWQSVLRGESEDFGACGGAMLDDWSAALVARALGNPSRADTLKRELRRRGVAAFGLVDQAA